MSMIGNLLAVSQTELEQLYDSPERISELLYKNRIEEVVDLDKAWQAIHFMLTGEEYGGTPPLSNAIFGMVPIGEEDVGYGPALGSEAKHVKKIADELSKISDDDFCLKYDPEDLIKADIYPLIWREKEVLNEYILPNFKELKEFYIKAAQDNNAVITFIN